MKKLKELIRKLIKKIDHLLIPFDVKFIDKFEKQIESCDTILNLGCGYKSILSNLKVRRKYTLGVDIFKEYIDIN